MNTGPAAALLLALTPPLIAVTLPGPGDILRTFRGRR
jgi:hypothetical protein